VSGIVGLWHRDGSRADRELLRALTEFLSFRGPDACETWAKGEIGLGHTGLWTSTHNRMQRQPTTVGGVLTVVADARLDAREELSERLWGDEPGSSGSLSDAELIAQSYAKWGEDCVAQLAGDFSFAIWDARERQLFCARDHFGIRPFYFAEFESEFLFSNTLDCIRLHPEFSGELDEGAIGDFLLFGLNLDTATTTFRQIRRLPPAHCITVSVGGIRTRQYWAPPTDGRIRYKSPQEYVEHFQAVLSESVKERLSTDRAGIFLSGGLDSSSIAAIARETCKDSGPSSELRAYTVVSGQEGADPELPLARETALFLGIPHETIQIPRLQPFDRGADESLSWPEPVSDPFFAGNFHQFRQIAAGCRVMLDGEGSDNLLHFEMWPYVKDMVRRGEWADLVSTLPSYLRVRGSVWPGIRRRIREAGGNHPDAPRFPEWLNPDFAARRGLKERIEIWGNGSLPSKHPVLPSAHAALSLPHWTHFFENENAGVTKAPVEVRFPYLDLRVVKFALSLPPYPWLYGKRILREAMAGKLPERIRIRPKTPLRTDPLLADLARPIAESARGVEWAAEMERYVGRGSLMKQLQSGDTLFLPQAIRPVCLNFWLQSCSVVRYKLKAEAHNG
jgi:asparagine synthase (glutamine-hydrolysing)